MKLILRQAKFKIKSPELCKFIQMWQSCKSLSLIGERSVETTVLETALEGNWFIFATHLIHLFQGLGKEQLFDVHH